MCCHHAHKLSKYNTHPFCIKSSNWIFALCADREEKPSSCLDVLPLAPTCYRHFLVSLNHLTVSVKNLWANISREEIIYSSCSRKTVNIPGCLAGSGSFNDAITALARHGNPALTDKRNVHWSIEAAEPLNDPLAFVDRRFTAQSNASARSLGCM